jgi:hypothetical protein
MNAPLSAAGSTKGYGGRFNFGALINPSQFQPFSALYIAQNHATAIDEKYATTAASSGQLSIQELALGPNSHHFARLEGNLNNIIDLRKTASLQHFLKIIKNFEIDERTNELARLAGIKPMHTIKSAKELMDNLHDRDWRAAPTQVNLPSNSQVFGKLVHEAGIEGIIFESVRGTGSCLAVFPGNFAQSESVVRLQDIMPESVTTTELTKHTWRQLM